MEVQWHKGRRPLTPRNTSISADSIRLLSQCKQWEKLHAPTPGPLLRGELCVIHPPGSTEKTRLLTPKQTPRLDLYFLSSLIFCSLELFLNPLSFFLSVSMYVLYYFHILFLFCNFKMMKWRKATWHTCIDRNRI